MFLILNKEDLDTIVVAWNWENIYLKRRSTGIETKNLAKITASS